MNSFRKSLTLALDGEQEGSFTARIATLAPAVDKDGDVTLPGAFKDGQRVLVSAYQHGSWGGALPIGDGVIATDQGAAYVKGRFWLNTQLSRDTYEAVKAAGDLQQYSYGYNILGASTDPGELAAYPGASQILKSLDVIEISPVLVGAGVNTGTLSIKSAKSAFGGAALDKAREAVAKLKAGTLDSAMIAAIAEIDAMTDELDDAVDALMLAAGIPDPDEMGEDMTDGETTGGAANPGPAPETSTDPMINPDAEFSKGLSFADHSTSALAGVLAFVSRAKSLAELRAKKRRKDGRVLSAMNRTRLNALHDGLAGAVAELRDLLDSTYAEPAAAPADASGEEKATSDELLAAVWLDMQRRQAELFSF